VFVPLQETSDYRRFRRHLSAVQQIGWFVERSHRIHFGRVVSSNFERRVGLEHLGVHNEWHSHSCCPRTFDVAVVDGGIDDDGCFSSSSAGLILF
jgi:hypothetical protein